MKLLLLRYSASWNQYYSDIMLLWNYYYSDILLHETIITHLLYATWNYYYSDILLHETIIT